MIDNRPNFSEDIPEEDAAPANVEDADFEASYDGPDLTGEGSDNAGN